MNLIDQLRVLGKQINNNFNYVNCGGCAVIASIVGTYLREIGIEPRIVVGDDHEDDGTSVDEIRNQIKKNTIKEWNKNGLHFGHVAIEFDYNGERWQFDTDDTAHPDGYVDTYMRYEGYLSLEEVTEIALDTSGDGWNWMFNRDQIPHIHKMVFDFFNTNLLPKTQ